MKHKISTVFVMIMLIAVSSCKKDALTDQLNDNQGVSFTLNAGSALKSTNCFTKEADYANVVISGTSYKVDVFYINSQPYTNTIKLPEGDYLLTEFFLMDDNNTPNDASDDVLIAATPHQGSEFAQYVVQALDIPFTIEAFKKTELGIQVLCYEESDYSNFGFVYYNIGQVVVREQFFFGDICISNLNDYEGSLYANQSTGLQIDMSAIAKIEVWRNGVFFEEFNNEAWFGEGQPLRVRYADVLNHTDNFEFKLYILVKQGTEFNYVHFHTWDFTDDERIEAGNDGVVDYVLGNCSPDADLILPPYEEGDVITIVSQPNSVTGKDAVIHDINLYTSGSGIYFWVSAWTWDGTPGVMRALIEFDLTQISQNATILDAKLSLYGKSASPDQHSSLTGSNASILQRVTSSWDEHAVNWTNQPTSTTQNQVNLPQSSYPDQDYLNIDVKSLVQDMIENPNTSFGFMIRLEVESYYRMMAFATSDNTNSLVRPKLVINYTE